ncbi:hypothetical protein [Hyphomonas johnsonii]|uniref:Signal transduction protein with EFhand domain n=1 Tax=Hyphomonas johnsonii MHS-2 TaxID=1280950 RepID=A0A059FQH8_9PROT|nr:hypothetical protein [Hyphomonas johnsonii]KCZ92776.1 signal transduction protein with EFhand domain [Hyphomonas johnsonii MHS-2]
MTLPHSRFVAAGACLATLVLVTGCASSRQPPRDGTPPRTAGASVQGGKIARPVALLFAGMDRDQNHVIDEAELALGIAQDWKGFNVRGRSGVSALSLAEWSVYALGDADALPNHIAFDANFDGQVSEVEFRNRLTSEFAQLDRDHDLRLTRAEMLIDAPARAQSQGSGRASGGGEGRGDGRRPPR